VAFTHFQKGIERVLKLVSTAICFDQNPIGDSTGLALVPLHVSEYIHSLVEVTEANTHVNQAVVEDLIRPLVRLSISL
jgi:hypothetical protein